MRPKLSVITPSLNQGAFIERTIRSVLDQGYENLEYLILDGGSSDDSVEVIRKYEDRLTWWVSEPDEGQTDALNKGFARASGEIVTFINSDDYFLPGAFEAAVGALEASTRLWVIGGARVVDEHDDLIHDWAAVPPESTEHGVGGRHWWILAPWGVPQPSTFWRREVFDRVGMMRRDMDYAFDTEFFLRIALSGLRPELIDEQLSARVVHDEAKSADPMPFRREARRYPKIFRPMLTPRERAQLFATSLLLRTGTLHALERIRAVVMKPTVNLGQALAKRRLKKTD